MPSIPYSSFKDFLFRCPILPVSNGPLTSPISPLILESIYLASPDLFNSIIADPSVTSSSSKSKTRISLLKYYTRMKYRCTPFGLFSGCGMGKITENKSNISLSEIRTYRTFTRLDMNYLCALTDHVSNITEVAERLHFFPNSSLYPLPHALRYVEYKYQQGKRKYYLSEVEKSDLLQLILNLSETGKTKTELVNILNESEIDKDDAIQFINDLVTNQLLVSELEPSLTDTKMLETLILKLEKINVVPDLLIKLKNIEQKLSQVDKHPIGRSISHYESVEQEIQSINVSFDKKYLFQSDLFIPASYSNLNQSVLNTVKDGLFAISALSATQTNPSLRKFKEEFLKRYEYEEIPLAEALDSDIGIGFGNMVTGNGDINSLIEGIPDSSANTPEVSSPISAQERFLFNKYNDCISANSSEVVITDDDLEKFPVNWNKIPTTLSCLIEVVSAGIENENVIVFKSASGPTIAKLVGRFCHIDSQILEFAKILTASENNSAGDSLIAEILHLPEARVGNVLARPSLREYEIPYLAQPTNAEINKIPISDLMVSVTTDNGILLRSKKLKKKILPRLTTAHNFSSSTLPVYQFLCSLQTDSLNASVKFNWGRLVANQAFMPRIRYKKCILSPAIWHLQFESLKSILGTSDEVFFVQVKELKEEMKLPDHVFLVKGDHKLFIDLTNIESIKLLRSEIQNQTVVLEEFLFDEKKSLIKNADCIHINEVILGLYQSNNQRNEL